MYFVNKRGFSVFRHSPDRASREAAYYDRGEGKHDRMLQSDGTANGICEINVSAVSARSAVEDGAEVIFSVQLSFTKSIF